MHRRADGRLDVAILKQLIWMTGCTCRCMISKRI
ncbi:hypothetical protein LINGRAHAP2_LOCUS12353 [Linum grandiflorum]